MNEFSDLASESARPRLALKYKGFKRLFSGQLIGLIGDQLFPIAMVGVLASRSNLPFSLGVVFGARFLGLSLLIIFSGVIADRLSRVQLLVASDAMRAAAVLGLLIAGLDAPVWTLALLTFAMGAGEAVFQPAYDAFIPDLVDGVALLSANATTNVLRSVGQFVGPALGAVIVTELGPTTALTIDAATFVVSSVAVLLAGRHVIARPPDQEVPQRSSMIKEALEGLQIVLKLRWLGLLQLMSLVHVLFAVGPWMVLLPFIASEGGSGLYGYGSALSAFALGGLLGAPLASRISDRLRQPGLVAVSAISLFSLACFALATAIPWPAVLVMCAVAGAGTQFFDVVIQTAIQRQVPSSHLGRVFSIDFFASFAAMPAGQFLAGILVATVSQARVAMAVSGVVVVGTCVAVLLSPAARRLSPQESAAYL